LYKLFVPQTTERDSDASTHGKGRPARHPAREWFEQQLVETFLSAHGLKANGRWSEQELGELLSESSLTAAILPRYHINLNVKRTLGQRLGKLEKAA
jgi:hypothetical protein